MSATAKRALLVLGLSLATTCLGDATSQAQTLFREIAGVPLQTTDPRLTQMVDLINQNQLTKAAQIASADHHFYNVTLRHWAMTMSNRAEDPNQPMNDFVAMVVGNTRDTRDARLLLYDDFIYLAPSISGIPTLEVQNNNYFQYLDTIHADLANVLVENRYPNAQSGAYKGCSSGCPFSPPPPHLAFQNSEPSPASPTYPAAGVLTSRNWFNEMLYGGTNRRAVEHTFRKFMCVPFKSVADSHVPREHVRQDVDRRPGGNSNTFATFCVTCHGILDALAGAFAHFDMTTYVSNTPPNAQRYMTDPNNAGNFNSQGIGIKNLRNNTVYPYGYVTIDDSFVNYATQFQNAAFGWRGASSGNGPSQFGQMIANSHGFSMCMAQRVYSKLCLKKDFQVETMAPTDLTQLQNNNSDIETLANWLEANNYNLRGLFEQTAILPQCIGD